MVKIFNYQLNLEQFILHYEFRIKYFFSYVFDLEINL